MIPRVLHRIWVGGKMPPYYKKYEEKWEQLNPGWSIKTWGDGDFGWLENQELFDNAEKYVPSHAVGQFKSDIARYEILHRFGGVYADCDVEPRKSFEILMDVDGFAGWEEHGTYVGNTIIGAKPGNSIMRRMIDELPSSAAANKGRAATWISGPRVLTRIYKSTNPTDFEVYPQHYFYPYSYSDLKNSTRDPSEREYPEAYAIHHWGHQRELRGRPLVANGNGELSVSIMAHQKRKDWVPLLQEQLPMAKVIWDKKNDRWDTGSRALSVHDKSAQWHMVVQDDALLPPDFYEGVKRMLTYVPAHNPVGLYYGAVRPRMHETRAMVARAARSGAPFIVHNGPWWGVGIVLPVSDIDECVEWGNAHTSIPNYDRRISKFYQEKQVDCYYTNPSLIEHRHGPENPSLVPGRTALNRKSWQFVGPQSALQVDWSGEPVRSRM